MRKSYGSRANYDLLPKIDIDQINFNHALDSFKRKIPLDNNSPPWFKELYRRFEKAESEGETLEYSKKIMTEIVRMGGTDHNDPTLRSTDLPQEMRTRK